MGSMLILAPLAFSANQIQQAERRAANYVPLQRQAPRDTYGTLETHREAEDEAIQQAN